MIVDKLKNADLYKGLSERFAKAFDYLEKTDLKALEPGKYELDGDKLKIAVQEYESKPKDACKVEAHKRYADIQVIVSGEELIGMDTLVNQISLAGYNEVKDVWHFDSYEYEIKLVEGMFAVFFPEDIHMPCLMVDEPSPVKKVVLKVLL